MSSPSIVLATIPFGCTALMASVEGDPYLQYGALGLCAIIVIFLCKHISTLTENLDHKDRVLGELYAEHTKAMRELSTMLRDRPCLMKDSRANVDG